MLSLGLELTCDRIDTQSKRHVTLRSIILYCYFRVKAHVKKSLRDSVPHLPLMAYLAA
jgi:hypothetical protein